MPSKASKEKRRTIEVPPSGLRIPGCHVYAAPGRFHSRKRCFVPTTCTVRNGPTTLLPQTAPERCMPDGWTTNVVAASRGRFFPARRSEEHTSELQSHVNLVCRLLLEKKKKKNK